MLIRKYAKDSSAKVVSILQFVQKGRWDALGPNQIGRENVQRNFVMQHVASRDLGSVIGEIQDRVRNKLASPEHYNLEYGGAASIDFINSPLAIGIEGCCFRS